MLQKFEIHAEHTIASDNLRKYVSKKLGGIDTYLPRHDRQSAHGEVHLKEVKAKDNNNFVCEIILHLPHDTITIKECALNMYASIDIVETKLKQQIKKHKDLHKNGKLHRHLRARFMRKFNLSPEAEA